MNREKFIELNCGDIDIRFYGGTNYISVAVNQSIPNEWQGSTYYQRINHRFDIKNLSDLEGELLKRLGAFKDAVK